MNPSFPIVTDTHRDVLTHAIQQVNGLVVGKAHQVKLAFVAALASGHLLLEDRPGVGKTTLAHAMARTLGLDFSRVQFTADLLPSDILGVAIHTPSQGGFVFHRGPVFTGLLLADEINRSPPRTQSALLEAMAENQVTADGTTHPLPDPFFVIATQNPTDPSGTFPLPDSQLDRFMLRVGLGYPSPQAERELLAGQDRRHLINAAAPVLDAATLRAMRAATRQLTVSDTLLTYLQALLQASRHHPAILDGLSPRAGLALLHAARAHAFIDARDHVRPDDIQAVFVPLANHRLHSRDGSRNGEQLAGELLAGVPVD